MKKNKWNIFLIFSVFGFGQDSIRVKKDSVQSHHPVTDIEKVVFQNKQKIKITDITQIKVSRQDINQVTAISGGVEGVLKSYPGVNSNTELSSQYMVRGGSYDENLTYINNIEIYRPLLVRNSQQEGLSIINPDMVEVASFSSGGFEAKYGDKMSSVLNIYYRNPTKNELRMEAGLLGGRLSTALVSKNKKFTSLVSVRYRDIGLIFNTLNEETDFKPLYADVQSYLGYELNSKWKINFLGIFSQNRYEMIPKYKVVNFGTALTPMSVEIGYAGRENDSYRNKMGVFSLNYKANSKWNFLLDIFGYQNREREYYTISSGYRIHRFDPITSEPIPSYDIGGQMDHARNDLLISNYGLQFKMFFSPFLNTDIEAGVKYEKENITDRTNEWQLIDYQGYVSPREGIVPGQLDTSLLKLHYHISGNNYISPNRFSFYSQLSQKFLWRENKIFFNAGVRFQHWSFNHQQLWSPRFQWAIKPNWKADILFRMSAGIYYQAPFYKEIKNFSGEFSNQIKAQKSFQILLGKDYEFQWYQRPFKLTTELYYKSMSDLMPYFMDNVRIRYSGKNNAKGYAYGIDTRLYGAFVPGVDSYISASYGRVFENIDNKGYAPRATDQRFRFSVFYQDYMPKFPSMKVNLTLIYASGLPTGSPIKVNHLGELDFENPYSFRSFLPSYKRVDIGLSKVFIDEKKFQPSSKFWKNFRELTLGVQIFNAFNIRNVVGNQWISDVSSQNIFSVPIYLTGRFFNVKLEIKI